MLDHDPTIVQHMQNIWEKYLISNEAKQHTTIQDQLKHFLNRNYLKEILEPCPELHFVGNILIHYIKHASKHDVPEPLDSYHVFQLYIILGITWQEIINLLHRMQVLVTLFDAAQNAWRDFQIAQLQIPIPYSLLQAAVLSKLLVCAESWQSFLNKTMKNYSRNMLFTFRLAHAQYHPAFLPQLAWDPPDENDWAKGLANFLSVINSVQHMQDFIEECDNLLQLKYYGHHCMSTDIIQYSKSLKSIHLAGVFARLRYRAENTLER